MFTKNVFTQKDPIAEAIKNIAEGDYKAKMEELKGQQHKLDKNKNNKLDADDFKILRGEKKSVKEDAEQTDEAVSPFDWKNRPSELKKKPGEMTGHDSKKTSTGTVYTKKAPKPEKDDVKEEVEQIDELSKDTLTKYRSAAWKDKADADMNRHAGDFSQRYSSVVRSNKRNDGINNASKRIGQKDRGELKNEEVENIEERSLTSGEKAEMEKNVKGMKKNLAGFKARYGDRAKSVMYATATKQAKKD